MMSDFFHQAAESWSTFMLAAGWQAALVAGVVFVLLFLLRRWISAPLRYALLLIVLVKFATPPFLALPTGFFSQSSDMHQRVVRATPGYFVETTTNSETDSLSNDSNLEPTAREASHSDQTDSETATPPAPVVRSTMPSARFRWSPFWMSLYLVGCAVTLIMLVRRYRSVRRIVQASEIQQSGVLFSEVVRVAGLLGLKQTPVLRLSEETDGPFAIGAFRPVIVLPRSLTEELAPDQLTIVIAHELAHIRRRDLLIGWFETLVSIAWWFHPALWWLRRSLRQTREDCCDDLLLAKQLAQPERYCETLIEAADRQRTRLAEPLVLGFVHREHPAARRIRRLMDASLFRAEHLRYPALFLVILMACIMLPGMQPDRQPVTPTTLEGIGGWRNLPFQLNKSEAAVIEECKQLAQTYFFTHDGRPEFAETETREKLEAILEQYPECFYAQFLLSTWHRLQGHPEEAARLMNLSLKNAPVVLTQTYHLGNGTPAAGIQIRQIEIECNRVQHHSLDPSLVLNFVGLETDAKGTVKLPVFDTVFRTRTQSFPEGYQAEFQNLGWFESRSHEGTLPAVLVWKTWSRPRDFTRTAAESKLLKNAEGTRTLQLDLGPNHYQIGSISRGQANGSFINEDGKGHPLKSTARPLPALSNATYMDHALIELTAPAESDFDLEQVDVLDSQTKLPLQTFQYGAGFTSSDQRLFHLFALWETLPETVDLVLSVYNYESNHFRLKLSPQVGATVQTEGATLEIKYLEAGHHTGWSSNTGFFGEAQDKSNTSEVIIDLVQGERLDGALWVVSKSGRRLKLDHLVWSSSKVGYPPTRIMLPLSEIDHFEILPKVAPQTIYFEQLRLPARTAPLEQQLPTITFPVQGQARKFTSEVFSPLLVHFESQRGHLYTGISSNQNGWGFQERPSTKQDPESQTTVSWWYLASVDLRQRTEFDAPPFPGASNKSSLGMHSNVGSAGFLSRKTPLELIESVRFEILPQPAN
ncbi:M56 family metallopeptidase [Gimesia panareensis]|nr:M56 family metallopeptidase [Gimesia panareensis]